MAQARCRRRRQSSNGIGETVLKDLLEGKPLRHPIHPMLVHFPIGFLVLSFLLDLVSLAFPEVPNLVRGSFYAMLFGVIAALLAAVPGFVDYSDIRRDHPGKVTATRHMTLNLMVVELYAFQEFCTHRFGPLSEGSFHRFNVQCPWHNSCFDIRTGKVTHGPAKVDLKTFKVETRDGKIGVLLTKEHDQKT